MSEVGMSNRTAKGGSKIKRITLRTSVVSGDK